MPIWYQVVSRPEVESVACNVTWTVPFVQPLGSVAAVVTGGLLSMLMWPVWKSSALPAASVDQYVITWLASPLTGTGAPVYCALAPPSIV